MRHDRQGVWPRSGKSISNSSTLDPNRTVSSGRFGAGHPPQTVTPPMNRAKALMDLRIVTIRSTQRPIAGRQTYSRNCTSTTWYSALASFRTR
jgi:hypothetical protein